MTELKELILFYSKRSKNCVPCINFIRNNGLPVKQVALDTLATRELVQKSSNIQITAVPTLMVVDSQNTLQLYIGLEKVIMWLKSFLQANTVEEEQEETPPYQNQSNQGDDIEMLQEEEQGGNDNAVNPLSTQRNPEKGLSELKRIALEMEKQRKEGLGYDEKNLPRWG